MSLFPAAPSHQCGEPEQLKQLLVTKPVKLIVGRDGTEIYVNRGFLSRLSVPLNAFVDGKVKEPVEGCVALEDVDSDIFSRIAQFVYSGAYTGFTPTEKDDPAISDEGTEITDNVAERPLDGGSTMFGSRHTFAQGVFGGAPLFKDPKDDPFKLPFSISFEISAVRRIDGRWHSVQCRSNNMLMPRVPSKRKFEDMACDCGAGNERQKKLDFISAFMAKRGSLGREDVWQNSWQTKPFRQTKSFEHIFIGHARIWVFAHRYANASLMDLACSQLAHELTRWTISASAFVPDFGGLVRYVYGHTVTECQLRLLVAQFAACVVEDVSGLEGWSVLKKEVPDFMADLVNQMTDRLN